MPVLVAGEASWLAWADQPSDPSTAHPTLDVPSSYVGGDLHGGAWDFRAACSYRAAVRHYPHDAARSCDLDELRLCQ